MEAIMFRALFKPPVNDIEAILKFLEQKLKEPRKHLPSHSGGIMVELYGEDFPNLDERGLCDECWKTAEWIRHKNPAGDNLKYQITGYEGTKILYTSGCEICRSRKDPRPHYEHE